MSDIGKYSIGELFEKQLVIPIYQRPYLWDITQVENLLKDFLEIFEKNKEDEDKIYLIGNMIFYNRFLAKLKEMTWTNESKKFTLKDWQYQYNENKLEIVDGQQRTITLALLLYNLEDKDNKAKAFLEKINISNPLSKKAIYDNNKIIQNYIDRFLGDEKKRKEFLEFIKRFFRDI